MNMVFKNLQGKQIDLEAYIAEQYERFPDLELHVGTDSQSGVHTEYCTVIAFRYPNRGAHCIFSRKRVPRMRDRWQRLYHEAELSVEVANWIHANTPFRVDFIDLDYNDSTKHFSNTVLAAGAGLATAMGYATTTKAIAQPAARAADNYL